MNIQSQIDFKDCVESNEKTAMHYQIRDHIVLPIVRAIKDRNLPIMYVPNSNDSRFIITAKSQCQRVARSEFLELRVENDGSIALERFIPRQKNRIPVENITVNPNQTQQKAFMGLLKTLCFELSRYYNYPSLMGHLVYSNDPRHQFKKLAKKAL